MYETNIIVKELQARIAIKDKEIETLKQVVEKNDFLLQNAETTQQQVIKALNQKIRKIEDKQELAIAHIENAKFLAGRLVKTELKLALEALK